MVKYRETYFAGLGTSYLSSLFMWLNSCSTRLSHGEYCAFISTLTFILRAVWNTVECLWIVALSIKTTMLLFTVCAFCRSLFRVLYMKFSKSIASVPPSNTCIDTTASYEIAARSEKLFCPTESFGLFLYKCTIFSFIIVSRSWNFLFAISSFWLLIIWNASDCRGLIYFSPIS